MYQLLSQLGKSIMSVISILLLSSFKAAFEFSRLKKGNSNKECIVIGNGPSMKEEFHKNYEIFKNCENLFCVNFFIEHSLFYDLKPKNYVIADNIYWEGSEFEGTVKKLAAFFADMNEVSWKMTLFITNDGYNSVRKKIVNKNITVIPFNKTGVDGFKVFRHWMYGLNLGMPKPNNVLNATLFLAVNRNFKKINLYGADHSWISDLYVNDKNEVCCAQNHFYDKQKEDFVMPKGTLGEGLKSIAEALESYELLRQYSDNLGCKIINKTKKSFLDVFEKA